MAWSYCKLKQWTLNRIIKDFNAIILAVDNDNAGNAFHFKSSLLLRKRPIKKIGMITPSPLVTNTIIKMGDFEFFIGISIKTCHISAFSRPALKNHQMAYICLYNTNRKTPCFFIYHGRFLSS